MGIRPSQEKQVKKRSIKVKWSFANMLFCFLVFTIFATISYQTSIMYFLEGEKEDLVKVVNSVSEHLEKANDNLTPKNIYKYLGYREEGVLETFYDKAGREIKSAREIGIPRVDWRYFQVYDKDEQIIFAAKSSNISLYSTKSTKPVIVKMGNKTGFIITRRIRSKNTGKVVGYLQSFNELNFYYVIRNKLLFILIALEVVAMLWANFIGYFVSSHLLKPLSKLHVAMKRITKLPSGEFEEIKINSGDEIEELADVFNGMMQKKQDYLEGQERFVSDVSHELRTPLAVLDGHINLLLRWGKDDPQQLDESLEASRQEIQKMSSMIQDMLDIARLKQDSGNEMEQTQVVPCVSDLVNNFRMVHQNFTIEFETRISSEVWAQIYKNHYIQALTILMDNAVKYSGEKETYIKVSLFAEEDMIISEVSDHGLGIGEADQAFIFERFFRADKARNREIGGTGLGLSIIENIVKIYKGSIAVDSEIGKGSIFTMKIPKAKLTKL